jgi:5-formyltetrahydrofolate cyclo-ligase
MNKSDLRKLYLEKRKSMPVSALSEKSGQIANRFFENIDLSGVSVLHTFIPIRKFNEIDTSMIYYRIWRDMPSIVTGAPRMVRTSGDIESVRFDQDTAWAENSWGIREPSGGEFVEARSIDLVIVPLLCFDEAGHRVGYGKGFYDRFLSECRPDCRKVGVSYFPPVEVIDDVNDTDVRLHICVTPTGMFRPKEKDATEAASLSK